MTTAIRPASRRTVSAYARWCIRRLVRHLPVLGRKALCLALPALLMSRRQAWRGVTIMSDHVTASPESRP
jgi:hypothetical protein